MTPTENDSNGNIYPIRLHRNTIKHTFFASYLFLLLFFFLLLRYKSEICGLSNTMEVKEISFAVLTALKMTAALDSSTELHLLLVTHLCRLLF